MRVIKWGSITEISFTDLLVNCLDNLIMGVRAPDVKGVRGKLLEPNTILIHLLLAEVLVYINCFSQYLQKMLAEKFARLIEFLQHLAGDVGPSFSEYAV